MKAETNVNYIYKKIIKKPNGNEYTYFYFIKDNKHIYSSRKLKDVEEFAVQYAQKNNIKNIYK